MSSRKKILTVIRVAPRPSQRWTALAAWYLIFIYKANVLCVQVLECSWDELWNKVQRAQDLDHIIAAHDVFLDTIISRCLLDNNSRV